MIAIVDDSKRSNVLGPSKLKLRILIVHGRSMPQVF